MLSTDERDPRGRVTASNNLATNLCFTVRHSSWCWSHWSIRLFWQLQGELTAEKRIAMVEGQWKIARKCR